ncbi:shikimate dehydrogenase [Listeria marthii]|uniref:Shikimate dehydrogenase (NADP(+)) n=1 Tax=Listeria marthii FSL S4-120 TaxID=702457 RepID=A0ABP2JXS8_9LIST|nr:shikimate dehydrogenase [Listeria marthii]EFR87672.1 shikimate 5-dehydrogenase [Listeria marthii FSL S4-120]MBF2399609.1 shikimate dehydrogenase [Listeria marthii]MBF2503362.1 shikimate dehydrogenase [Listeria marthii]MBF2514484.1 shikimate dehydrogenase [Listeria marthii]
MEKYVVIGNPIRHSLSPAMQNRIFQELGMNAEYNSVLIEEDAFETEIKKLMDSGVRGFNITTPFKERILPFLDELEDLAAASGAVNTVLRKEGKWYGFNTDGKGYLEGLEEIRPITKEDSILITGAGGASKAIYLALTSHTDAKITVANRTTEKAIEMTKGNPNHHAMTLQEAENELADFTIIIQTTSIGLEASKNKSPISLANVSKGTICSDIIYNPAETAFLKEAKKNGAITQNGLPMFVNQGALAFEIWTGIKPERSLMKEAVLEQLGGN